MLEHERIAELDCGCREDKVTGITTHYCQAHDPERQNRSVPEIANATGDIEPYAYSSMKAPPVNW